MPESAISAGVVDLALPAEEMGAAAGRVRPRPVHARRPGGDGLERDRRRPRARRRAARDLPILRNQVGHDFGGYKTKTFLRRVQRRMQVTAAADGRGLCRAAAPGPAGGRGAVPRPADRRDQLLPRRRCLRGAGRASSSRSCSRGAAPRTWSASGCRAARRARRCSPSPSCCASTWRR